MNPLNGLILKKFNDKLDQLHQDNKHIIALLENINNNLRGKEKLIIHVEEEKVKTEKLRSYDRFDKTLWEIF